ncbi:MAG: BadF/BadG/BcrA/BcrD ATPase family protein [Bryobacteraceae bacterium]|jgi:predicted CoA-substrate-specific enzyme activase
MAANSLLVGLDIGSTTVKAVVMPDGEKQIVWQDYRRHETEQGRTALDFLKKISSEVGLAGRTVRLCLTGSGASEIARVTRGRFIQEVNAVSLAIEARNPDAQSAIELGGQDAKVLFFDTGQAGNGRKRAASMNDKCAGGTGAFIDKLTAKLSISRERLCRQMYRGYPLHPVAGKCGVFAETDINGLQKQGVPAGELMASLFEAIVIQNLTVLTRGRVLCPKVLLLGGPNKFLPGLREAWQEHIPRIWQERGIAVPPQADIEELVFAPENAEYYGALGAVEFAAEQGDDIAPWLGPDSLERWLDNGHGAQARGLAGVPGLSGSDRELETFLDEYRRPPWSAPTLSGRVRAFLGVDGGSTSTKAVLIDEDGAVLAKAYRLSQGNPIRDAIEIAGELERHARNQGVELEILGAATTGYAKHVLGRVIQADTELVETVAHARSGIALRPDVDVIVDVGGQDIKLIVLKNGKVRDFMLNTQCSAGNGYFLQATAQSFGVSSDDYAERAFHAKRMPEFSYGCAVFLQADIVNFQRQGWTSDEILAALAAVLPKNIWLYVAKVSNLPALGRKFLLQGGTQKNLAAVKAQVDFLRSRMRQFGLEPDVTVHEHCAEAGAIGAALEAIRLYRGGQVTRFPGLAQLQRLQFETTTGEATRCSYCANHCLRTFIDFETGERRERIIIASCEKGATQNPEELRETVHRLRRVKGANPNLVEIAGRTVTLAQRPPLVADPPCRLTLTPRQAARNRLVAARGNLRLGIPRVCNQYLYGPFFSAYLESLGVAGWNIVWSDVTSEKLYREGGTRGAIDPCYPSKVAVAHVHNLIFTHHAQRPLQAIFLPQFDILGSSLEKCAGSHACPTASATPLAVAAAFRTDTDTFAAEHIAYLHPLLNFDEIPLLSRQMYDCWHPLLGLTRAENARAIETALKAQRRWLEDLRARGRTVLDQLEAQDRIGIVMLGRAYQHDPGLNHGIFEEFQKLGYPVLSQTSLPLDAPTLERVFGADHPLDIEDVWKHSFSASTSQKVWAAKFVARHPNLIGIEVSNFKCGHDAPAYQLIQAILESAGKPYFAFRDLDENKPAASMHIRIETIDYYLRQIRRFE